MNKETKKKHKYNSKAIEILSNKYGLSDYYIKQSINGSVKGITPDTIKKDYKIIVYELEIAEKSAITRVLQNNLSIVNQANQKEKNTKEKKEIIGILKEKEINRGLSEFEEKKDFLKKGMNLGKLSTLLNTNVKYLSLVIKKNKAQNFNLYINNLRINYIKTKIQNDQNFLKYKISHLSNLCGYSATSTFSKSFLDITGITPSEFIQNLKDSMKK